MKKKRKRKSPKTYKDSAEWQAPEPPRYRKLAELREELEVWPRGPAGGFESSGKVAQRVMANSQDEEPPTEPLWIDDTGDSARVGLKEMGGAALTAPARKNERDTPASNGLLDSNAGGRCQGAPAGK